MERDGFVWCYELTNDHLRLKLFRILTLGRISLRQVAYIRQRGADDLSGFLLDMFLKPFRAWYWPHPAMSYRSAHSTPYVIRTQGGTRVFVRLRGGFHYWLRAAMGNAKAAARKTSPETDSAPAGPEAASRPSAG